MDEMADQCAAEYTPEPPWTGRYGDRTGVETTSGATVLPQDLGIGRLFESVRDAVIVANARTGRIVLWNPVAAKTFGYSPSEAPGMSVESLVPEYLKPRHRSGMARYRQTGHGPYIDPGTVLELTAVRKDGEEIKVEMTLSPIAPADREAHDGYVLAIIRDVTERKRVEEEIERLRESLEERVAERTAQLEAALAGLRKSERTLREGEERFRLLVEGTRDYAIFMLDPEGRVVSWNAGAERIKGYTAEEIVGEHFSVFYVEEDVANGHPEYELRAAVSEGAYEEEGWQVRKDGSRFWASVVVTALRDAEGNLRGFSKITRDVTERKVLERQLTHQALHDGLTGLPNRVLFLDRLEHALARLGRRDSSVAVLFLDLDDFKIVNDSLGHEAGDTLLVEVAGRLKDCLREEDTIARLGGDEFTVLLEEVADASEALLVAERIVRAFASPFEVAGREVFASCSVGVSLSTSGQSRSQELLRDADVAMYRAKAGGKARHAVYDPEMGARARGRLELASALRRALSQEEFRVHYQPKVRLGSDRVAGMEALVRWEHPERGLILPSEFVPLAEETGLILPMGRWVLEEACRQAKEWQERYPADPHLPISVNLSARQFRHQGLLEDVAGVLGKVGLEPSALKLEVTESAVMDDVESAIATMRELKGLGVGLSIDDFGTGHSSLNYLRRFPVDELKIDKSFVDGLGREAKDGAIMRAMTMLASALGLVVVAEGVEDAEQLACLRELECDLVQGYYFARPLAADAASALLASGSSFDH